MDVQSQQPVNTGSASHHTPLRVADATQPHTVPSESPHRLENQPDRKTIRKNAARKFQAKHRELRIARENASLQFRGAFLDLLETRYRDQNVLAHDVYQIYVQDPQNPRMESTQWSSLNMFVWSVSHGGLCNVCRAADGSLEYGSPGVYISSISNWRNILEEQPAKPRVYREVRMRKRVP